MRKKKIAVIAGGDSGEFGISMNSGKMVASILDNNLYDVYLIKIKGKEWSYEKENQTFAIDKNDFSLLINENRIHFDCVFCAIHGSPGENGKMPAYFEMLNIPYTSSNSLTSAITFNKHICNTIVSSLNIVNVAKSLHFFDYEKIDTDAILNYLDLPLFVKPNSGGSSVGISKVKQPDSLLTAIKMAFIEDSEILVEEFVEGRELTCGVMETTGKLYVFPVCEVKSKNEYFDFESKYDPLLADEIIPAPISESLDVNIKKISAYLYKKLNCAGVVRFDYIYSSKRRKLFFLEVNTVPGMTGESIVPKMAMEMGIELPNLYKMMIEDALERKSQLEK